MGRTTKELLNSWQEQETFLFFRTSMKEWKYTSTPPYAFMVAVVISSPYQSVNNLTYNLAWNLHRTAFDCIMRYQQFLISQESILCDVTFTKISVFEVTETVNASARFQ
jgi:hypothetical protein